MDQNIGSGNLNLFHRQKCVYLFNVYYELLCVKAFDVETCIKF